MNQQSKIDLHYMREALKMAKSAYEKNEVPIGALIVSEKGLIIAKAHNQVELLQDSTAHAEMLALTSASNYVGNKYLQNCTIYITIEPCLMCISAIKWARINRVVYGALEPKYGYENTLSISQRKNFLNKIKTTSKVLEVECRNLMIDFFKHLRNKSK